MGLNAMEFTKTFLRAKSPCADGFRWFVRNIEDGSGYQEALDTLVNAGRVDDACWLLTQFGPTNAVLSVDSLDAQAVVFAGPLEVRGGIDVDTEVQAGRSIQAGGGMHLEAGWGIKAGESIHANGSIKAGESLSVGNEIHAGVGYGVYAGLNVQVDSWESSGQVQAARKPESLMSGCWAGPRSV
jgi:hypothetical protein